MDLNVVKLALEAGEKITKEKEWGKRIVKKGESPDRERCQQEMGGGERVSGKKGHRLLRRTSLNFKEEQEKKCGGS